MFVNVVYLLHQPNHSSLSLWQSSHLWRLAESCYSPRGDQTGLLMFVFLYLGGGKVHRRIADHHVEILEGCTHKRHRWEQKPNPQTHHWAGPVCRVPPSPPLPLALCWYSDYVCWACSALKVWARQVAKEWLSHWMFDYVQTVTVTIICVTVLPVNVFMSWHFRDLGTSEIRALGLESGLYVS